jgi:hypothetical protein
MKHGVVCGIGVVLVLALSGGAALGQATLPYSDDFEAYNTDDGLSTQSDFETWDENPNVDALVTDDQARSGKQSVRIADTDNDPFADTDLLLRFPDEEFGGCHEYIAYQYLPSDQSGETYFIGQSEYNHNSHACPGGTCWALQIHMNASSGTVTADFSNGFTDAITDEWVELRVLIVWDNDLNQFYYAGEAILLTIGVSQTRSRGPRP